MSPREKFIKRNVGIVNRDFAGYVFDAMQMASTHDPDHSHWIRVVDRDLSRTIRSMNKRFREFDRQIKALKKRISR